MLEALPEGASSRVGPAVWIQGPCAASQGLRAVQTAGFAGTSAEGGGIWSEGLKRNMVDLLAEEDGEAGSDDEAADPQSSPHYITASFCSQLAAEDVNKYWQMLPMGEGWPKGLTEEFQMSGTNFSLYRDCIHELFLEMERSFAALKQSQLSGDDSALSERRTHFLLQGTQGTGKSVALASAVEFARLCGAVVVYVPSCLELLDGGMYHRNEEAGGWDTPDHARRLLTNLLEAHGHRLDAVPSPGGEGSLKDVAEGGLSRNTNSVDAALELIDALRETTAFPVVFAMDDYNALYSHTAYYEAVSFKKRRMIMPGELRLASKLRMLEHEPLRNGVVLAAPTYSSCISPALKIPYKRGAIFSVPAFSEEELDRVAEFYADYDAIPERPEAAQLLQIGALTCGNGKEFRKRVVLTV